MKEKKKRRIFGRLQKTLKEKWKKEEFSELEYRPTSVKDLLTEMKDISELIIDLAYSAVLFDNEEIAEEVRFLEVRMDRLNYDIRMMAMMAARTKEDAEQLAGILQLAEAAESISNAAGDVVNLLYSKTETRPILPQILKEADEKIHKIKVMSKSKACNRSIGTLAIETETSMRIIAIRRKKQWIYNPRAGTYLKTGDTLIVRGTEEGYKNLRDFLHGKKKVLE